MNEEEIEELKEFTIDLNDIDELALGLEICSKKSNMVIQEYADIIIQLQQENKKLKERINKLKRYIEKCLKLTPTDDRTKSDDVLDNEYEYLLKILKEVE